MLLQKKEGSIRDIRGMLLTQQASIWIPAVYTVSGNTSINLMGVRRAHIKITTSDNFQLTLQNLSYGTELTLVANTSSGTKTMTVAASTPSGATLGVFAGISAWAQTATNGGGNLTYLGLNLGTSGAIVFSGNINQVVLRATYDETNAQLIFI